jgi:hypothetical protein
VTGSVVTFTSARECTVSGLELPDRLDLFVAKSPEVSNGEIILGGSFPHEDECWIDFHGYALEPVKSIFNPGIACSGPVTILKSRLVNAVDAFDLKVTANGPCD